MINMKMETIKSFRLMVLTILALFTSTFNTYATDDLITQQIVINLEEAGLLPSLISPNAQKRITNLKVIGPLNGTDVTLLRRMLGRDDYGKALSGYNLKILDLSEAKIVEGGNPYYRLSDGSSIYTKANDLGDWMFDGCSSLTSIKIPESVTELDWSAFEGCSSFTSVTVPESVTFFHDNVFKDCTSLSSITLPKTVTYLGGGMFNGCKSLKSITIPEGYTGLGGDFFNGCSSLTSIAIPKNIFWFEARVFRGCSSLKSIYVYRETPPIFDGDYSLESPKDCIIYVPKGSLILYKIAPGWEDLNLKEFDATGIENATTDEVSKEAERYSVGGQKLSTPVKGFNIVKMNDGTVKKVMVK